MVESESEASAVAIIAVLTAPLSLEGGLAAELRPANLVHRVLSLFRNVRPGSDLSHFQIWFQVLARTGLQQLTSQPADFCFSDWWRIVESRAPKDRRSGLNSLIILSAWYIWKYRNECVFDGRKPEEHQLELAIWDEATLWSMAGVKGLSQLLA